MELMTNARVVSVRREAVYAALELESAPLAEHARPGQFLHIRCGELPLRRPISIAGVAGTHLTVIFEIKGKGTQWLSRRVPGECLDILGPLGNGFPQVEGRILLAGGGVGVPPMHFAAQRAAEADAVLAFRSADRVLLRDQFAALCGSVLVMSDDGSIGVRGFAAQGVVRMLEKGRYNAVFACGPGIMLKTTAEACKKAGVPCYVSLEERMGCGLGACLTCAVPMLGPDGTRTMKEVCKDGPVFRGEEVLWDA